MGMFVLVSNVQYSSRDHITHNFNMKNYVLGLCICALLLTEIQGLPAVFQFDQHLLKSSPNDRINVHNLMQPKAKENDKKVQAPGQCGYKVGMGLLMLHLALVVDVTESVMCGYSSSYEEWPIRISNFIICMY